MIRNKLLGMFILFLTGILLSCTNDVEKEREQPAENTREICFSLKAQSDIILTRSATSLVGMQWKIYCFDDQYNYQFAKEGTITDASGNIKISITKGKIFRFLFLVAKENVTLPSLQEGDTYWNLAVHTPQLPLADPMAVLASQGNQDGTLRIATFSSVIEIDLLPRATRIIVQKGKGVSADVKVNSVQFQQAASSATFAHIAPQHYADYEELPTMGKTSFLTTVSPEDGVCYMLPGICAPYSGVGATLNITDDKGEKKTITVSIPKGKVLNATGGKTYYITLSTNEVGALSAAWTTRTSKKTLRLASQNLWGKSAKAAVDYFHKIDADVMCAQECNNLIAEEVEAYGLYIHSHTNNGQGRCSIISKYPFEETTPHRYGVYIHLGDGIKVLVMNCHGAFKPYGPYQLNGIDYGGFPATSDVNSVIETNKNARKDMVEALLEDFRSATTQFVSISGDFNEPSWFDWTEATTQAGLSTYVVQWPTSHALWKGGIKGDAYRTVHPDPVTHPGFTWTPRPAAKDTKDRIDLTLYNVNEYTTVKSCKVVGESENTSDIIILPWIFDHRGLYTEFIYEL